MFVIKQNKKKKSTHNWYYHIRNDLGYETIMLFNPHGKFCKKKKKKKDRTGFFVTPATQIKVIKSDQKII